MEAVAFVEGEERERQVRVPVGGGAFPSAFGGDGATIGFDDEAAELVPPEHDVVEPVPASAAQVADLGFAGQASAADAGAEVFPPPFVVPAGDAVQAQVCAGADAGEAFRSDAEDRHSGSPFASSRRTSAWHG